MPGDTSDVNVGARATVEVVDWDNDGRLDLLLGAYDGLVRLYAGEPLTPAPFDILTPTGTIHDPTPEITWEASTGAVSYDVVIATSADLSDPVREFFDVTGTSLTLTDPLALGTYYVGVTAVGTNHEPLVDAGPDATIDAGDWLIGSGSFTDPEHEVEASNNGLSFEVGPAATHTIFVSSELTGIDPSETFPPSMPNWGGIGAADWAATYYAWLAGRVANWDGLALVYQGIVSTQAVHARDRIVIQGEVINTAGITVAVDEADFWNGSHLAPIDHDEYGNPAPVNSEVWTGTGADGTWAGASCGDWNVRVDTGIIGNSSSISSAWANEATLNCGINAHIYAISPPLDIAPTVDAGDNATAVVDQPFTRDGTFDDLGDVFWTATVDYGDGGGPQTLPLDFDAHSFQLDHTYTTTGPHTVTVTINDSDPGTDAGVATFEVEVGVQGSGFRGQESGVRDQESGVSSQGWTATVDYDDGAGAVPLGLNPDKTFALSHQYTVPGTYTVTVSVTDDEAAEGIDTLQVTVLEPPEVVGRHVFYNNSYWDDPANDPSFTDDTAIATDKHALLPGTPESIATAANYTSFSRGINGVMVDIDYLPPVTEPIDPANYFEFTVGNNDNPGGWTDAPELATFPQYHPGAGVGASDRITLIWPDHAIRNQWLEVTVLANAYTGLTDPHVFYFGSAVGESGNSTVDAQVTTTDLLLARNNPRNVTYPAAIDFPYDYDRDERVNATDVLLARNNQTNFLNRLALIDLSGSEAVAQAGRVRETHQDPESQNIDPSGAFHAPYGFWLDELERIARDAEPPGRQRLTDEAVQVLLGEY